MRTSLLALTAAVGLLLSASSGALTIDPNPVNQTRGGGQNADVYQISLSGDTLTLQVTVNGGTLFGLDVSMLFDSLALPTSFNFVSAASTNAGTGDVGATASVGAGNSEAVFDFDGGGIGTGQTSDQLVVQFQNPILEGWEGVLTFDFTVGGAEDTTYAIAVPEPALALLLGTGLLAAGIRRRA